MIYLELHNRAVEELLLYRFENAKKGLKHEKFDQLTADFDGVIYWIHSVPNERSKVMVSISVNFFLELQHYNANEILRREYGPYLCAQSEEGCNVSLQFDLDALPQDHITLARQAALLKRNCFAAVFERFCQFHALGEEAAGIKCGVIHYREDETLYICASSDRVTVIFSTVFKEPDDVIIGKVFMQELVEVRRRFDRAPQILYSQSVPPTELQGTDAVVGANVSFITFVLFPRHLTPTTTARTVNSIYMLRNYLHYHIKCSKGHVHRRMRAKTGEFIKILNRARPHHVVCPVIQLGVVPVRQHLVNPFANWANVNNGDNDTSSMHSSSGDLANPTCDSFDGELADRAQSTSNGYL